MTDRAMFESTWEPAHDEHGCKIEGRINIHWTTGPIPNHPGYALSKTRSVIRTTPKPLNKKERRKTEIAKRDHPGGYHFQCMCGQNSYHFPSRTKVKIEGYDDLQKLDTYECCLCHRHFDAGPIDEAVEKAQQPTTA